MVGNFDVDVQHQQRIGHLFGPLPPEMRNDTAFMDRIHAYLPGWDIPKVDRSLFTDHFGLGQDVLAEVLLAAAIASAVRCAIGASSSRWGAVGPRHERGQQDGLRVC